MSAENTAATCEKLAPTMPWPWNDLWNIRARDWRRFAAYERRLGRELTARETDRLTELRRSVSFGSIASDFMEDES